MLRKIASRCLLRRILQHSMISCLMRMCWESVIHGQINLRISLLNSLIGTRRIVISRPSLQSIGGIASTIAFILCLRQPVMCLHQKAAAAAVVLAAASRAAVDFQAAASAAAEAAAGKLKANRIFRCIC